MKSIEQIIEEQKILDVVHPDMSSLSKINNSAFAMMRRSGLGASDAAIYMGVNQWTTVEELLEEKQSIGITPKELEVANKEVVRKGKDLESLILEKFAEKFSIVVDKPHPMYRLKEHPQLTINFDGICLFGEEMPVPVEAKYVSPYADKYWDRSKCINSLFDGNPKICGGASMREHIEEEAALYGIPPYYYTQVQQQMLGLNALFGYFAVIFDKGWDFGVYKIFKDEYVQNGIIRESAVVWNRRKPS